MTPAATGITGTGITGTATTGTVSFTALGTGATVVVTDPARLDRAQRVVLAVLDAIDRGCSRFRPDSDLERVNAAGGRAVTVGPVLVAALDVALRAARQTDGDVDPTVGEAVRVLGYDRDFQSVARSGRPVVRVAPVPGWQLVSVDRALRRVRVPAGVRLDLGATAKALAADRAAERAAAEAGCGVLVSLGGDVATAGEAPPGGWRVGIADWHNAGPEDEDETVRIDSGGLASSSTTVRRWERGGEHLHHVVDPSTGRSAEEVWRTVSVAAATCVDANVASTAAIVRGGRSAAWLAGLGLPARLVGADGHVVRVGGWPDPDAREIASSAPASDQGRRGWGSPPAAAGVVRRTAPTPRVPTAGER